MENSLINIISTTCQCDTRQAEEFLNDEIRNLQELSDLEDLRYSDLEVACDNLGIDRDYVEYFVNRLCGISVFIEV